MKVYIHDGLERSLGQEKLINVKTDVKSARLSGDRFYLGAMCHKRHPAIKSDGKTVSYSLRYTSNCTCVICGLSSRKSNIRKSMKSEDQSTCSAEVRRRIEDICLAKELGIDVEDL